ncbi:type II secretion system protein, partial [Klebsiella pneumoniae]
MPASGGAELRVLPARDRSGFTLIELLVVVALIAIVSTTVTLALRDPA